MVHSTSLDSEAGYRTSAAEQLFSDGKIRYVNVRSTEAGCFLFRLERA